MEGKQSADAIERLVQRAMPLSREERLRAIDDVDPDRAGIHRRSWRSVRDLLKQIEFCSSGYDSRVRIDTLAGRMAVHYTTVLRTGNVAEAAGLLDIERMIYDAGGRTSNGWRIRWDRVLAVKRLPDASHPVRDASHRLRDASHRLRDASHPIRGIKSSNVQGKVHIRSSDEGERDDQKLAGSRKAAESAGRARCAGALPPADWLPEQIGEIRERAHGIERKIGRCRRPDDWSIAVKAVILSRSFGEQWLASAVEGTVVRLTNRGKLGPLHKGPWAYFTKLLQDGADKNRRFLNRELARITLPPALANYAREVIDPRLCSGGPL